MLKRIYIEIINRCNLSCSFCSPDTRPACTMAADVFDNIAAQVAPHCCYIYLHIKGEPLMHPQLEQILQSAARHGLMVNLTTNGLLLPQRQALLLQSPAMRQTNLSLHGYTPATHGNAAAWVAALAGYARAMAAQERYTVFRFWTLDGSRAADAQATQLLSLLEAQFPAAGSLAAQAAKRSLALQKGVFVSFEEQFEWPTLQNPDYGERGICYGSRTMLGILSDGTLVPCCLDSDGACPLGNVLHTPLDALLQSPRLAAMRDGFAARHVTQPLCRCCGYRLRFGTA